LKTKEGRKELPDQLKENKSWARSVPGACTKITMKEHNHCAAMNNVSYIAEKVARREK
jgi:hypothetical protein